MKTRAAVAFAPKQPLEIVEVELEGPRAGEPDVHRVRDHRGAGVGPIFDECRAVWPAVEVAVEFVGAEESKAVAVLDKEAV